MLGYIYEFFHTLLFSHNAKMGSLISRYLGGGIVIKSFTIKNSGGVSHWRQYSGNKYRTSAKIAKKTKQTRLFKTKLLKTLNFRRKLQLFGRL